MNRKHVKLLYKKEIMDVIRDKKTIIAMFILPLILYPLIFVVVLQIMAAVNTTRQQHVYTVAFTSKTAESEKFADFVKGKKDGLSYDVKFRYASPGSKLEKSLKDEKTDAYIDIRKKSGNYTFEVHYLSAVTNSQNAYDMIEEEAEAFGKSISEERVSEAGLDEKYILQPVETVMKDESTKESSVGNILGNIIPFMLIVSILMGSTYPAIDATSGERERGTLETLMTLPVTNMEMITAKFLSVATLALVSVFVNVLSIGAIAAYLYTTVSSLTDTMKGMNPADFIPAALVTIVCVAAFALFISAVFMCVCSYAKTFKEANNYITPVMLVVMFTAYIGFIPNIRLDYKMALVPVANICLLIKNLLVFKFSFRMIMTVLLSNVVYAAAAVFLLSKIYNSESVLFGDSKGGVRIFERRKNIKKGTFPTVADGLITLVVALLLMTYLGGLMSLKAPVFGVIVPQFFIGVLPVLVTLYIKSDFKKVYSIKAPGVRGIIGSIVLQAGVMGIAELLGSALTELFPSSSSSVDTQFSTILDKVPFVPALILIALLPAFCEEIMFRGMLFSAFRQKYSPAVSVAVVSVLFGISHMSLIRFIPTAILGAALGYAVVKTGSIISSSCMHFMNNALSVVLMYYGNLFPALSGKTLTGPAMAVCAALGVVCIPLGVVILGTRKNNV